MSTYITAEMHICQCCGNPNHFLAIDLRGKWRAPNGSYYVYKCAGCQGMNYMVRGKGKAKRLVVLTAEQRPSEELFNG